MKKTLVYLLRALMLLDRMTVPTEKPERQLLQATQPDLPLS